MDLPRLLLPHNPLDPRKPDFDFEDEHRAAREAGFEVGLIDTDRLELTRSVSSGPTLYRGWMVSADHYTELFKSLQEQGLDLLTTPESYRFAHHLPGWHDTLRDYTPASTWFPQAQQWSASAVAAELGEAPWIVKDYVKSAKHDWHDACYISHSERLAAVTGKFLELRGDDLEGGLVYRKFVPLASVGSHPKSGMPLTLEFRALRWKDRWLLKERYWEDGEYPDLQPPWESFEPVLASLPCQFYSVDIAMDEHGRWWIVEIGDGGVSGLPPGTDVDAFYRKLAEAVKS